MRPCDTICSRPRRNQPLHPSSPGRCYHIPASSIPALPSPARIASIVPASAPPAAGSAPEGLKVAFASALQPVQTQASRGAGAHRLRTRQPAAMRAARGAAARPQHQPVLAFGAASGGRLRPAAVAGLSPLPAAQACRALGPPSHRQTGLPPATRNHTGSGRPPGQRPAAPAHASAPAATATQRYMQQQDLEIVRQNLVSRMAYANVMSREEQPAARQQQQPGSSSGGGGGAIASSSGQQRQQQQGVEPGEGARARTRGPRARQPRIVSRAAPVHAPSAAPRCLQGAGRHPCGTRTRPLPPCCHRRPLH